MFPPLNEVALVVVGIKITQGMIITDESLLRTPCVPAMEDEVGQIVDALDTELKRLARIGIGGVGLAAPQIGVYKQVAIVRCDEYNITLANCRIAHSYDKFIFKNEGCLSFPGKFVDSYKYNEIHVVDNLWDKKSFIATGLVSCVIQHELNHISGILISDIEIPKIPKLKPNDRCFCGSNVKFKRCHGRT